MTSKKNKARVAKDQGSTKKIKKKTSVLVIDKVEYVDYKDVNLLSRFVSDRSKIRNRRVSGNDVQQQRDVALAIKNAREMALLPYTKRVSQTRAPRGRDGERGERRDRGERNDDQVTAAQVEGADVEVDDAPEGTEEA